MARRKSAQTSAKTFVSALRSGNSRARKALGLRSRRDRTARNLMRRRSTGGQGG